MDGKITTGLTAITRQPDQQVVRTKRLGKGIRKGFKGAVITALLFGVMMAQQSGLLEKAPILGETVPAPREQGEILVDADNGEVLCGRNQHAVLYPASTTKILTALVVLENEDIEQMVTVGPEIYRVPQDASRAWVYEGQQMSVRELLYALMLPSGNDAAYTLAAHLGRRISGDESMSADEAIAAFVAAMNRTAEDLGLDHSHFVNPDGYHHPDHYSTAYDIALIASQAMRNLDFQQIVQTTTYPAPPGITVEDHPVIWKNTNRLLDEADPYYLASATGIKTGYTTQAGYCLASSASRPGRNLIAVVLNSTESGVLSSSLRLLEYGFSVESAPFTPREESPQASRPNHYLEYGLIAAGLLYLFRFFRRKKYRSPRRQ